MRYRRFILAFREGRYRRALVIFLLVTLLGTVSLIASSHIAKRLRDKEKNEMALWSYAMERISAGDQHDPLFFQVVYNQNIPFVLLDQNGRVERSHMVPREVLDDPDRRMKLIMEFSRQNQPISINSYSGRKHVLFYGNSSLFNWLLIFPYIQVAVLITFTAFGFFAFRYNKQNEQNRVWIGLAKETAHQLGTPISSLMGWIDFLRSQEGVDPTATEEMSKDLTRLVKVADRFGKIGSETALESCNLNEVVGGSVHYFKTRIPRRVELRYNGLATAPISAMINVALFEWVVENLLKNSLDALQGSGTIEVTVSENERGNRAYVDVKDTGKGIAKGNWKKIFEPGFTTKTRGWGLGLSLSKRIVEEYHSGRIWVVDSELGVGTTIRIALRKN